MACLESRRFPAGQSDRAFDGEIGIAVVVQSYAVANLSPTLALADTGTPHFGKDGRTTVIVELMREPTISRSDEAH
jgi:hypothetical protein